VHPIDPVDSDEAAKHFQVRGYITAGSRRRMTGLSNVIRDRLGVPHFRRVRSVGRE
jgi:hypothetical protein